MIVAGYIRSANLIRSSYLSATANLQRALYISSSTSATKSQQLLRFSLRQNYCTRDKISSLQPTSHVAISGSFKRQHRYCSSNVQKKASDANGATKSTNVTTASNVASSNTSTSTSTESSTIFQRFLGPKPMPERNTFAWYREILLICTVFAITGSTTMIVVRPAVSEGLGIKGSLIDGPWSYRICSLVIMTPLYATLLVAVGTVFGRHAYFRHFSVKIFSRFGIPPELMDPTFHETKHTFRKW